MRNNNSVATKRLQLAMKFGVSGAIIAIVGALFSFYITLLLKKEYTSIGENKAFVSMFLSGTIIYAFVGVVWTCTFAGLSPLMKRIKTKALPIIFIVFSVLAIVIWLSGLTIPLALDMYLGGAAENGLFTYTEVTNINPIFNHLRVLATIAILPGLFTILGWILMFVSGIIAACAKKEELANNRIKN